MRWPYCYLLWELPLGRCGGGLWDLCTLGGAWTRTFAYGQPENDTFASPGGGSDKLFWASTARETPYMGCFRASMEKQCFSAFLHYVQHKTL